MFGALLVLACASEVQLGLDELAQAFDGLHADAGGIDRAILADAPLGRHRLRHAAVDELGELGPVALKQVEVDRDGRRDALLHHLPRDLGALLAPGLEQPGDGDVAEPQPVFLSKPGRELPRGLALGSLGEHRRLEGLWYPARHFGCYRLLQAVA